MCCQLSYNYYHHTLTAVFLLPAGCTKHAQLVCLFICPSVHVQDLGKPGNELIRLVAAKGSKTMPVQLTVEAQLSLHKRNITNAALETRKDKKLAANYEQAN